MNPKLRLYNHVRVIAKAWENPDFSLATADKKTKASYDYLRSSCCANVTELYQMLKMFPDKKQWVNGDPSEMRNQMLQSICRRKREQPKRVKE